MWTNRNQELYSILATKKMKGRVFFIRQYGDRETTWVSINHLYVGLSFKLRNTWISRLLFKIKVWFFFVKTSLINEFLIFKSLVRWSVVQAARNIKIYMERHEFISYNLRWRLFWYATCLCFEKFLFFVL